MTDPLVQAANERLANLIPRAAQMGIRFVDVRPGTVRATVPLEGNANHFGVMYAGVTFTVAEVLGGALHAATWDVTTHYPLVKSMTIDFTRAGHHAAHRAGQPVAGGDRARPCRGDAGRQGVVRARGRGHRRGRHRGRPDARRLPDPSLATLTCRLPQRPRCSSAVAAAFAPPMPCTPAPGGVAAEHRYTPGTPVA